jgi:hypothetical protein
MIGGHQVPSERLSHRAALAEIATQRRNTMSYTKPSIIANHAALSVVKSDKGDLVFESNQIQLTSGAAYQSAE